MTQDTKVMVIGLDGGSLDLIRSLAEKGIMPNLLALINEGVSGELKSVFPPITAPAWASFLTGKNPGKHGIFNFFKNLRDLDNRRIVSHDSIKAETLISIANQSGKKVASINMPVTYPPPA
ncbi:MAG: alkaline phosphatase family protein [Candidatus Abyssubacteria bacterium]|nr:alkaline phosphatase family protein [Candidatus Abyssubacteria bacterium]